MFSDGDLSAKLFLAVPILRRSKGECPQPSFWIPCVIIHNNHTQIFRLSLGGHLQQQLRRTPNRSRASGWLRQGWRAGVRSAAISGVELCTVLFGLLKWPALPFLNPFLHEIAVSNPILNLFRFTFPSLLMPYLFFFSSPRARWPKPSQDYYKLNNHIKREWRCQKNFKYRSMSLNC